MKNFLVVLFLVAVCAPAAAQPIFRRGGFQFAFTSDSVLQSDYFYATPDSGSRFKVAVPSLLQGRVETGNGKTGASSQMYVIPTLGFKSGNFRGEAYLGGALEQNPLNNSFHSYGFGQRPVDSSSAKAHGHLVPGGVITYTPNYHFSFSAGYDKNFIGEGYYSLFLSDNASNNAFFKASTSFWKVKYSVMYSALENIHSYQAPNQLQTNKYSTTHVISLKPTKWLEVVLFESIVWQNKDSLNTRGFDLNYFNPVIFYRPVEYSLGSADNAMLGGGFNFRPAKNFMVYSQVMLDEFLLKEMLAGNGWWANKWGVQGGFKWYNVFDIQGWNLLGEVNVVRPYTYSHGTNNTNYGHHYSSLAHPWGANFYQAVMISQYRRGKHRLVVEAQAGQKGYDAQALRSYGGNLFVPYGYKIRDYGNSIAQGTKTTIATASVLYGYTFSDAMNLEAFGSAGFSKLGSDNRMIFQFGLRTPLFNRYGNF
ncbi:MAG: hypothetical protein V4616_03940 [Bacteroidota bacterium]